jgi:hypothetical protein
MAEHAAVNRRVVGSSPTWGVFSFLPLLMGMGEVSLLGLREGKLNEGKKKYKK